MEGAKTSKRRSRHWCFLVKNSKKTLDPSGWNKCRYCEIQEVVNRKGGVDLHGYLQLSKERNSGGIRRLKGLKLKHAQVWMKGTRKPEDNSDMCVSVVTYGESVTQGKRTDLKRKREDTQMDKDKDKYIFGDKDKDN